MNVFDMVQFGVLERAGVLTPYMWDCLRRQLHDLGVCMMLNCRSLVHHTVIQRANPSSITFFILVYWMVECGSEIIRYVYMACRCFYFKSLSSAATVTDCG